jgi:hypothetical protein
MMNAVRVLKKMEIEHTSTLYSNEKRAFILGGCWLSVAYPGYHVQKQHLLSC